MSGEVDSTQTPRRNGGRGTWSPFLAATVGGDEPSVSCGGRRAVVRLWRRGTWASQFGYKPDLVEVEIGDEEDDDE
jgi:hypothetical protein